MYRTKAGLVCHRNPDETVRSVDRSTALRLNTGVHAKHPGQLPTVNEIYAQPQLVTNWKQFQSETRIFRLETAV